MVYAVCDPLLAWNSSTRTSPPKYDMALSGKVFNRHKHTWLWLLVQKEKFLNRNTAFFICCLKFQFTVLFLATLKLKIARVFSLMWIKAFMKAAYNMLCIFFWSRSSPSFFSFLNMAGPHQFSFSSCLLPSSVSGMSSSTRAILAEPNQLQLLRLRCLYPCNSHCQLLENKVV